MVKWYAYQLQKFYAQISYDLNGQYEIRGRDIPALIARTLLEDNFQIHHLSISNTDSETAIYSKDRKVFSFSDIGSMQTDYFLIDEQEDDRFTKSFLEIAARYFK